MQSLKRDKRQCFPWFTDMFMSKALLFCNSYSILNIFLKQSLAAV